MDYMVFFKDWGGQLLSGFCIIGGIWAYLRHDRKIKCQEKVLNELQIRQLTKVEEEGKKAEIKCNFIPNKNGGHIRFVNAGKSDARNVHVEIITPKDELEGLIIDKWEDYEAQFKENGIRIVYFPYTKGVSSTAITTALRNIRGWTNDYSNKEDENI